MTSAANISIIMAMVGGKFSYPSPHASHLCSHLISQLSPEHPMMISGTSLRESRSDRIGYKDANFHGLANIYTPQWFLRLKLRKKFSSQEQIVQWIEHVDMHLQTFFHDKRH